MIAELIAVGAVIASAVSGWVYAFRSRGQANEAFGRARIAEARADAAQARAQDADAARLAATVDLKAKEAARAALASELDAERRGKSELLAKLAATGVPVGPVLVDDAIDRLYAHGRKDSRDPAASDKNRAGRPVSDEDSDFAEAPTPTIRPR